MEVHAHAHTPRKKWTHYFWEFLMLFLAVTLGFFVENQREHYIEQRREKQFMRSMKKDLEMDTTIINRQLRFFNRNNTRLDSLIYLLNDPDIKTKTADVYFLAREASRISFFIYTDRTINQMKNSGAFRLISKPQVADSIIDYYRTITDAIKKMEDAEIHEIEEFRKLTVLIFDPRIFDSLFTETGGLKRPAGNPPLQTYDPRQLMALSGWVHYIKTARFLMTLIKNEVKNKAINLIELLKKEYHIE